MKIYKKQLIERKKIRFVICNKCGKNIDIKKYKDFLNITKLWGYNSNFDNEVHEFDICNECYEKFIGGLKIEPKVTKKRRFICL